jgi:uncharacterized protein
MKNFFIFCKKLSVKSNLVYLIGILVALFIFDICRLPENQLSSRILVFSVRQYQGFISPGLGNFVKCKHKPSCSEYSCQAIEKYGTFQGVLKTIGRLLRCSPWNNEAGWDPP